MQDSKSKWAKIGTKNKAGVLVPLFSVYSQNSTGIGEFLDLKLLVDWCRETGNSIIQLLPLNEVGFGLCPYDALSSFALEPMYITLAAEPYAKDKAIHAKIKSLQQTFPPAKMHLDYAIQKEKIFLMEDIYALEGEKGPQELERFEEDNSYWLEDFALYKVLKGYHNGYPWYEWETDFKERDILAIEKFRHEYSEQIRFQKWMQYACFKQLKEARGYANSKGILLKGDLPILVSRDSADVWAHPEFFKLEFAAGAPPDMYCAKGQRWGMPTYDWGQIESDGFRYLKEKLRYAQNFYDILRIDHVVGIFRIWSIPYDEPLENKGLNGSFDPADENKWGEHGRKILSVMLESTDMLLCAEDLGVIPKVCTDTLAQLLIPGNDVQRWTKDWRVVHDFLRPQDYRQLSVAMLSTHDTTNWPAWWENEAGTVDEDLFRRRCSDHRKIGFENVKDKLFDERRSRHGRLRWLESVDSVDKLVQGLSPKGTVPKEHLADFIDLYENSYHEKEKLWKQLGLPRVMREKCDAEIIRAALKVTLDSKAVFSINTIIDWLYLTDLLKGDSYQYRINTPGTISPQNWSLTIPLSLEELLKHKVNKDIRKMVADSGRI